MLNDKNKSIEVEKFSQSEGFCGPASIKILLSYFKKNYTEDQLAHLSNATSDLGTEHEGMIQAIKEVDGYVFVKEKGTIEELEYFLKEERLPVIVGWFDRDEDHYSVVVNVTEKNVIMVDPATNEPERWIDRNIFSKIWFDFVGKSNRIACWGWYMVVTFDKKKFPIKGGYYY